MATKSLSILGKTAVGNVRLPMKPGRAGTMTHDYLGVAFWNGALA